MENFNLNQVKINDGFCYDKMKLNENVTLLAVYNQFKDNRFKALECNPEDKDRHIFYDSDVAKWLEACAYSLLINDNNEIRNICNKTIDTICKNQLPCGYFNSYFQVVALDKIFTQRGEHELYCAGHLFEAAVAWKKYQNDDRLMQFSEKYVDYIILRFVKNQDTEFITSGHEEIELALLRLYDLTRKKKYLKLAEFFIDNRGKHNEFKYEWADDKYAQSHLPVREQFIAEGHSVRALYLYTGMADLCNFKKDKKLREACAKLFDNIVNKRMYITGGLGATRFGERFTIDYDLPNASAYSETCAAIALEFFVDRLMLNKPKSIYGDVFERVFYNGLLSGYSHNGKAFFYVNPLEVNLEKTRFADSMRDSDKLPIVERKEVFGCSCCPPNMNRFLARLPEYIYYKDNSTIYVNQLISSTLKTNDVEIEVKSSLPYKGDVKINVKSNKPIVLKVRIPSWAKTYKINKKYAKNNGFAVFESICNDEITINFKLELRKVFSNGEVLENRGRFALMYGPLVLAMEQVDNEFSIHSFVPTKLSNVEIVEGDIFKIKVTGKIATNKNLYNFDKLSYKKAVGTLIPYFEWANRGENDMKVYF